MRNYEQLADATMAALPFRVELAALTDEQLKNLIAFSRCNAIITAMEDDRRKSSVKTELPQ